jgi:hypothetical protein
MGTPSKALTGPRTPKRGPSVYRAIAVRRWLTATYLAADTGRIAPCLSPHARRALVEISSHPRGVAEEFLTVCGFKREMLAELVVAGLITVAIETVQAGAPTIKVERYRITDDGRKVICRSAWIRR